LWRKATRKVELYIIIIKKRLSNKLVTKGMELMRIRRWPIKENEVKSHHPFIIQKEKYKVLHRKGAKQLSTAKRERC
jgi:hypothetical protein